MGTRRRTPHGPHGARWVYRQGGGRHHCNPCRHEGRNRTRVTSLHRPFIGLLSDSGTVPGQSSSEPAVLTGQCLRLTPGKVRSCGGTRAAHP